MSLRCPKGHSQGFERVSSPNDTTDRMVCRQCRTEAIIRLPACICGCKEFSFRPKKGEYTPLTNPVYMQCQQCGRYVTIASGLLRPLPQTIGLGGGGILGFWVGKEIWNYMTPISDWPKGIITGITIATGLIIGVPVALLLTKLARNILTRMLP